MVSRKSPSSQQPVALPASLPRPRLSSPLTAQPLKPGKWDEAKAFFLYSKVIFLARTEAAVGFLAIVLGSLDWSPFFGLTGFDTKQVAYLGGISLVKGVVTEWSRRTS